jgi:hypothetical protein
MLVITVLVGTHDLGQQDYIAVTTTNTRRGWSRDFALPRSRSSPTA